MIKKMLMMLVMKCETPSKKKNYMRISKASKGPSCQAYIRSLHSHDKHDPARYSHGEKSDDIENADEVQDYIAWASHGAVAVGL